MIIETFDSKQTYELGYKLGCEAKAGDIYCLDGELGVGKTGLPSNESISSINFSLSSGCTNSVRQPYDVFPK